MNDLYRHRIKEIQPGSIAEELDLKAGDVLLAVNDEKVEDVLDYRFLIQDSYIEVLVEKQNGEQWLLEVEKDPEEDLGITFENGLMDEYRICRNKCVFCFIDQMPPGMRETLYLKDDDSRLSFLQGNYVTLTNLSEKDINRIIRYRLEPINISVHTMNPELRCRMLHNRFAGEALKKMDVLYEAGIEMNGQIVLCPDLNDGEELEYTIEQLEKYCPVMQSVSVVPVGLSRFREKLYPLKPVDEKIAIDTIQRIERWQAHFMEKYGIHFIHASDEFYILAGQNMPEEERYDGYLQLENGVGMLRLLWEEAKAAVDDAVGDDREREISLATGRLAAPYIEKIYQYLKEKYPRIVLHIYPIRNDYFGESITVSGLVTGTDLKSQLADKALGEELLLPINMFRSGESVFLDDITREDLQNTLQVRTVIVKSSGQSLVEAVIGTYKEADLGYQAYERS